MPVTNSSKTLIMLVFAIVAPALATSCASGKGGRNSTESLCDDSTDNDGDGTTDCEDTDCENDPACQVIKEAQCQDGLDDDNDGLTDCQDPDCAADPSCTPETDCMDGLDDDNDGLTDCDDLDCANETHCIPESQCRDGLDDDSDGLTDCEDPDCSAEPHCNPESQCQDGVDNDLDSFTDCEDVDCQSDASCNTAGFSCQILSYCYYCCPLGDQACFTACDNAASQAGGQQMQVLMSCVLANCGAACQPAWECYPCAMQHCQAERDNCGLSPAGAGGCAGIYACIDACPSPTHGTGDAATCPTDTSLTCIDGCFTNSDQQAADLFTDLYYCMFDHCYTECYVNNFGSACTDCGLLSCNAELSACLADT